MPLRRLFMVAGCLICSVLSCGHSKSFDSVSVRGPMHTQQKAVNTMNAGNLAIGNLRAVVSLVAAGNHAKEQPLRISVEPSSVVSAPTMTTVPAATTSIDWDCVAVAETGANWSMTGSRYSSALGIMNQAVRENATEEVAARILSGTASRDEQIAVGEAIVARFGFDAWAPSTVAKCS